MVTILGVSKTFAFGPYGEYRTFEKTETSDRTKVGHSTTSTTRAERASQCGLRSLNDSCSFSSLALLSCIYWRRKKISPIVYRTQKIYTNTFSKYVTDRTKTGAQCPMPARHISQPVWRPGTRTMPCDISRRKSSSAAQMRKTNSVEGE